MTTILAEDTTFTAPTVAVNAFNRTQNLSDLFISVFRPSGRTHWPGNLKKYRSAPSDATIVDAQRRSGRRPGDRLLLRRPRRASGRPTVDGARRRRRRRGEPDPGADDRVGLHATSAATEPDDTDATASSTTNAALTDALLDIGGSRRADARRSHRLHQRRRLARHGPRQRHRRTPRNQMGDPLHSQPVSVDLRPRPARRPRVHRHERRLPACDRPRDRRRALGVHSAGVPRRPSRPLQRRVDRRQALRHRRRSAHPDGRRQRRRHREPARRSTCSSAWAAAATSTTRSTSAIPDCAAAAVEASTARRCRGSARRGRRRCRRVSTSQARVRSNADKLALVIGGGYEADQDNATLTTDTIGNSIYIVDSVDRRPAVARQPRRQATRTSTLRAARWTTRSRRASASSTSTATASPIACTPATWAAKSGASTSPTAQPAAQPRRGRRHRAARRRAERDAGPDDDPAVLQRARTSRSSTRARQLHPRRHRLRPPRPSARALSIEDRFYALRDYAMGPMTQAPVRRADPDHRARRPRARSTSATHDVPARQRGLAPRPEHRRLERREGAGRSAHVHNQVFFSTFQPSSERASRASRSSASTARMP